MKKIIYLLVMFSILFLTSCQTAQKKIQNQMLEKYENLENYITLNGIVEEIEIDNSKFLQKITIECNELKNYISTEDNYCEYLIYSNFDIILNIGDNISFITVPYRFYRSQLLPIVSIVKDSTTILNFNDGKECLIDWVKQLQMK